MLCSIILYVLNTFETFQHCSQGHKPREARGDLVKGKQKVGRSNGWTLEVQVSKISGIGPRASKRAYEGPIWGQYLSDRGPLSSLNGGEVSL